MGWNVPLVPLFHCAMSWTFSTVYSLIRQIFFLMQPSQIGWALAGSGIVGADSSLFLFPILQRRFNNQKMYAFFASFFPIGYALMPLGYLAARYGGGRDGTDEKMRSAAVWVAIVVILIPIRIALFCFPYVDFSSALHFDIHWHRPYLIPPKHSNDPR